MADPQPRDATAASPAADAGIAPSAAPHWLQEITAAFLGRSFPVWDGVMVVLAGISTFLLVLRNELLLPEPWATRLLIVDFVFVGFFALEFLAALARAPQKMRFVRANWYDLIGLVPLPIAFLRGFRLFRVVHVLLWGSRFPHHADREFGGAFALTLFRRYEPAIVEDLTDPVLLKLLGALREALSKGSYAEAIGIGLNQRRDRLHGIVIRSLGENIALRLALQSPIAKFGVRAVEDQLVDVIVAALTDPELDQVIKESIDGSLADLEHKIRVKGHRHGGPAAPGAA